MSIREKLHVMVVDDMSTSRGLILQSLDALGIRHVRAEPTAQQALTALAQKPAHLVISDYNMPGATGLDLLAALRKSEKLAKIGFILITGKPSQTMIDQGRQLGMNNFITKPFETPDLRKTIEAVVGRL